MPHVATPVLPSGTSYHMPATEVLKGASPHVTTDLRPPPSIPPDLDEAYGIMSGIVFGLLLWIGLLLPALYLLF